MQKCWFLLMLLVLTLTLIAHVRALELNKDLVTSPVGKQDEGNSNLDNILTIRTPSSAVQDWSLVCQQLCGAALGGAVCAPYCKNLPFLPLTVQLENAEKIMDSKRDLICLELCGLQLGDDVCTCKNYITNNFDAYKKSKEKPNICAIFCDYNSVTLTGCAPCKKDKNKENMFLSNLETLFQQQVGPHESTPSNTPNWDEICASLCKTGDGGSLCNCDLSPFRS